MREFLRSIRVRLTLLYSGVLFIVAALLVAGLYLGLSLSLRHEPVSQGVIREQVQVNDGSATEERTFVEAQSFEHLVNERTLRNLRTFSLVSLAALFLASLAVGWVIAGRVLGPIAHITQVAREIQVRELSRRIELVGPDDELKQLADTFDSMLARLDAPTNGHGAVDLAALVEDAREEFAAPAAAHGVGIEVAAGPGQAVAGDRDVLKRALANLLDNAVRVAPRGSSVRLAHGELEGWAWVAVSDEGPGIPPAQQERIFDRFWRPDDARTRPGGGSGLGLAIVRQIAEAHRGSVEVCSEAGAGATFVLWLPCDAGGGDPPHGDPTRVAALT